MKVTASNRFRKTSSVKLDPTKLTKWLVTSEIPEKKGKG